MSHPTPNSEQTQTPPEAEEENKPRRFRRLGSSGSPSTPETSSEQTEPAPAAPEESIGSRLGVFAAEMGAMAPDHGLGGMLKKLLPRLAGDLTSVPDDRLATYLDHLSDRLKWVRHGGPAPSDAPATEQGQAAVAPACTGQADCIGDDHHPQCAAAAVTTP